VDDYVERLDAFAGIYDSTAQVIEGPREAPDDEEILSPVDDERIAEFQADVERMLAEAEEKPPQSALPTVDIDQAQAAVDAFLSLSPVASVPADAVAAAPPPRGPSQTAVTTVPPNDPKRATAAKNQTIRVDIERLDLLLNLVGELVINRTRISDIAATLGRELGTNAATGRGMVSLAKDLSESSALLARTTNEIQESIMKVRMVPIGQVFDRFPRTVRDLAKARGKEIRLEIFGADTDLDKTIVDEVGEPLMHLVRNCVDHGIEAPAVREARGKPRHGTIKLNAYHEGNQVILEISDDGARRRSATASSTRTTG